MTRLVHFFLTQRRLAKLLLVLILGVGTLSLAGLPRQGDPPLDYDLLAISTRYPGAAPEDVEINVTEPLEDELQTVDDIDYFHSLSMENYSIIYAQLSPDARNAETVKNEIRRAVDRVTTLPATLPERPRVEELRTTNFPVVEIAITGGESEMALRRVARDLELALQAIPGVGRIDKIGYRQREIRIAVDHEALAAHQVSLGEMMSAIRTRNVRTTGGTLESYTAEKQLVTFAEYQHPLDVRDAIIRSTFTGEQVRVSDLARVEDTLRAPDILGRANGKPGITLVVKQQERADIISMADAISARLESFRTQIPPGVEVTLLYDSSTFTRSLLAMVTSNGLLGFVFVIVVMLLFLDYTSAFWTAAGIPVAMCGAFIFFDLFGISINVISLSAIVLVLGILVDDAIVVSENVYRYKEAGLPPLEATVQAVRNIFWPVTAAVATTIIAFLPMLFMTGITGKFMVSLPIVVSLMLCFSWLESICLLPGHIAHAVPPATPPHRTRWIVPVLAVYRRMLQWACAHRAPLIAGFLATALLMASVAWRVMDFILIPRTDFDIFHIVMEAPKGTSLHETAALVQPVERLVDRIVPPEARQSFITRVGHHDTDPYGLTDGRQEHWAVITVTLVPAEQRDVTAEALVASLRAQVARVPGFDRIDVEIMEAGPPVGRPLTVTYISDDDGLRDRFEQDTITWLRSVAGVGGIESSRVVGKDELRLVPDYDGMARFGITALDVAQTIHAAFEGDIVTSVRREGERIDYRIQLDKPEEYRAERVLTLRIANRDGNLVPLGSFARFTEAQAAAVIPHYDGRRAVTITADVDTAQITSHRLNQMVRDRYGPQVDEHAGLTMQLGGAERQTQQSFANFYAAFVVAMIAIYFLLVVLFDSWMQPLLIMTAIPFALLGALAALMLHGLPMSFVAMIGMLGLVGVVVNDNIVMISHLNELHESGRHHMADIIEGAVSRFRPVVLTTVTTVAGLLPTSYGLGGDVPIIRPMVLVLAWGLAFATAVTLILTPALYSCLRRVPPPEDGRNAGRVEGAPAAGLLP